MSCLLYGVSHLCNPTIVCSASDALSSKDSNTGLHAFQNLRDTTFTGVDFGACAAQYTTQQEPTSISNEYLKKYLERDDRHKDISGNIQVTQEHIQIEQWEKRYVNFIYDYFRNVATQNQKNEAVRRAKTAKLEYLRTILQDSGNLISQKNEKTISQEQYDSLTQESSKMRLKKYIDRAIKHFETISDQYIAQYKSDNKIDQFLDYCQTLMWSTKVDAVINIDRREIYAAMKPDSDRKQFTQARLDGDKYAQYDNYFVDIVHPTRDFVSELNNLASNMQSSSNACLGSWMSNHQYDDLEIVNNIIAMHHGDYESTITSGAKTANKKQLFVSGWYDFNLHKMFINTPENKQVNIDKPSELEVALAGSQMVNKQISAKARILKLLDANVCAYDTTLTILNDVLRENNINNVLLLKPFQRGMKDLLGADCASIHSFSANIQKVAEDCRKKLCNKIYEWYSNHYKGQSGGKQTSGDEVIKILMAGLVAKNIERLHEDMPSIINKGIMNEHSMLLHLSHMIPTNDECKKCISYLYGKGEDKIQSVDLNIFKDKVELPAGTCTDVRRTWQKKTLEIDWTTSASMCINFYNNFIGFMKNVKLPVQTAGSANSGGKFYIPIKQIIVNGAALIRRTQEDRMNPHQCCVNAEITKRVNSALILKDAKIDGAQHTFRNSLLFYRNATNNVDGLDYIFDCLNVFGENNITANQKDQMMNAILSSYILCLNERNISSVQDDSTAQKIRQTAINKMQVEQNTIFSRSRNDNTQFDNTQLMYAHRFLEQLCRCRITNINARKKIIINERVQAMMEQLLCKGISEIMPSSKQSQGPVIREPQKNAITAHLMYNVVNCLANIALSSDIKDEDENALNVQVAQLIAFNRLAESKCMTFSTLFNNIIQTPEKIFEWLGLENSQNTFNVLEISDLPDAPDAPDAHSSHALKSAFGENVRHAQISRRGEDILSAGARPISAITRSGSADRRMQCDVVEPHSTSSGVQLPEYSHHVETDVTQATNIQYPEIDLNSILPAANSCAPITSASYCATQIVIPTQSGDTHAVNGINCYGQSSSLSYPMHVVGGARDSGNQIGGAAELKGPNLRSRGTRTVSLKPKPVDDEIARFVKGVIACKNDMDKLYQHLKKYSKLMKTRASDIGQYIEDVSNNASEAQEILLKYQDILEQRKQQPRKITKNVVYRQNQRAKNKVSKRARNIVKAMDDDEL